ncbi:MAG: hypothetical protein ACXWQR_20500 [Ktedonobacterales bacterium]
MKKWEYHEAVVKESEDFVAVLDQLGDDGWELVCMEPAMKPEPTPLGPETKRVGDRVVLKRRKQ